MLKTTLINNERTQREFTLSSSSSTIIAESYLPVDIDVNIIVTATNKEYTPICSGKYIRVMINPTENDINWTIT